MRLSVTYIPREKVLCEDLPGGSQGDPISVGHLSCGGEAGVSQGDLSSVGLSTPAPSSGYNSGYECSMGTIKEDIIGRD